LLVARGSDDEGALAHRVRHGLDVLLVGRRLVRIGHVEVTAERDADYVDPVVGRVGERREDRRVPRVAAPLSDLEGDEVDTGGDAVDPGAVEGCGDVAADPRAVAVPVGVGRAAVRGGEVGVTGAEVV
jgi:hypothetical protein